MKFSLSVLALGTCVAAASAFTVVQSSQLSSSSSWGGAQAAAVNRRSSTSLQMSASSFAKEQISSNEVVVFSKSYCPFCRKTTSLLDHLKVNYKVFELDEMDDGADIQDALLDMTGQRSVPNVFIKGEHLGGNDDVQSAFRDGSLELKLGLAK